MKASKLCFVGFMFHKVFVFCLINLESRVAFLQHVGFMIMHYCVKIDCALR